MSLRKTLFLAIVLLVAIVAIRWGVLPHEAARERSALLLQGMHPQQVAKVSIERAGTTFSIVNSQPTTQEATPPGEPPPSLTSDLLRSWSLESVAGGDLDLGATNALLSALVQLRFREEDRIPPSERAADLSEYGLASPVVSVVVTGRGADTVERTQKILFGNKNEYLPGKRFAKVDGADDVYLIQESSFSPVDKPATDFRNKSPIAFADGELSSLRIQKGDSVIAFGRNDAGGWRIVEPKEYRANQDAVASLTRELRVLRASDFIDNAMERLADYDLVQPQFTATLSFKAEAKREPLTIALSARKQAEQTEAHFTVSGRPTVYKVSGRDPIESLFKPVSDFRERRLFKFELNELQSISFTSGSGATLSIVREGDSYLVNGKMGDEAFVREAINRVRDLEAVGFPKAEGDHGFASPRLQIVVRLTGGAAESAPIERKLVVGKSGDATPEGQATVVLAGDDMKEPFLITEEVFKRLMPTEEQLVRTPPPTPTVANPQPTAEGSAG